MTCIVHNVSDTGLDPIEEILETLVLGDLFAPVSFIDDPDSEGQDEDDENNESNEGNESDEDDEDDEDDEGDEADENDEGDEDDEANENDENDEGNEGDEANEADEDDENDEELRVLNDNQNVKNTMDEYGFVKREIISFTTDDGVTLYGWMMKPANFDPSKK